MNAMMNYYNVVENCNDNDKNAKNNEKINMNNRTTINSHLCGGCSTNCPPRAA